MQSPALAQHGRKPSRPSFTNHTPRAGDLRALNPSTFPASGEDMSESDRGRSYTTSTFASTSAMGQRSSTTSPTSGTLDHDNHRRHHHHQHKERIVRQHSIHQSIEDNSTTSPYMLVTLSRSEDSRSMLSDSTNPPTYSTLYTGGSSRRPNLEPRPNPPNTTRMITQTSHLRLPRNNDSRELAFFLRTTGPSIPRQVPNHPEPPRVYSHLRPPRRAVGVPKSALKFLKLRGGGGSQQGRGGALPPMQRRTVTEVQAEEERLCPRDEGGLLSSVQQKVSSTGTPYLELRAPISQRRIGTEKEQKKEEDILSPEVLESRVSVRFHDDLNGSDVLSSWLSTLNLQQTTPQSSSQKQLSHTSSETPPNATTYEEVAHRLARQCPTPIRPAASEPPSPIPESAVSMSESYQSAFDQETETESSETTRAPLPHPAYRKRLTISLPDEELPVKHPTYDKDVEIRHPFPRRMGSHPVLSQRASHITPSMYQRHVSDSPGPPPPKSPLRLRHDHRTIEGTLYPNTTSNSNGRATPTPRMAPSIKSVSDFHFDVDPIRATVTTECTGPISRPKSRNGEVLQGYPSLRRGSKSERAAERLRARKLRERPTLNVRTIDSVVNSSPSDIHISNANARHRLRKTRPQIHIPSSSYTPPSRQTSMSSNGTSRWEQRIAHSSKIPVSPVPSLASIPSFTHQEEGGERISTSIRRESGYTPISPSACSEAATLYPPRESHTTFRQSTSTQRSHSLRMSRSPRMCLAEQVPFSKVRPTHYAPRPRSASMGRKPGKRARNSSSNDSRSLKQQEDKLPRQHPILSAGDSWPDLSVAPPPPPPIPDFMPPPPTRALPPTPPASGSERLANTSKRRPSPSVTSSPTTNGAMRTSSSSSIPYRARTSEEIISRLPQHTVGSSFGSHTSSRVPAVTLDQEKEVVDNTVARLSTPVPSRATARFNARLEALEKQNALLSAALVAVLRTNGDLNAAVSPGDAVSGAVQGGVSPIGADGPVDVERPLRPSTGSNHWNEKSPAMAPSQSAQPSADSNRQKPPVPEKDITKVTPGPRASHDTHDVTLVQTSTGKIVNVGGGTKMMAWQARVAKRSEAGGVGGRPAGAAEGLAGRASRESRESERSVQSGSLGALDMYLSTRRG
ncbi:hypothetical protein TI39_contig373g00002 [Zymoseptoria brevis]|uniref:Uncharacterized protein n=1 Tax=Zymoseptoria brevis TaxID=1047168 RepID=A0A0F4GSD6_9PEZI|nr:hypothetical protein TI39_contig373g00002 [Zymoseptoria brevis]